MLDKLNRTHIEKKERYYKHLKSKNKVLSETHKYTIKELELYLFKQEMKKLLNKGLSIKILKGL